MYMYISMARNRKKIFKEIMNFHSYDFMYNAIPGTRNPALGVTIFTILIDPFLVIITIALFV